MADELWQVGVGVEGGTEQGVEWIALVPDDKAGCSERSPGTVYEPVQGLRLGWQSGRIETKGPGRAVAPPVEIGHVLPVLGGDCLEFFGRPSGSVPPPRCHQAQLHQFQQSQSEQSGLPIEADVHRRPFLAAFADEAERVSRARPRELLQWGPRGEPDAVVQQVVGRVRRIEVRDPGEEGDDILGGTQERQQRTAVGGHSG